MMSVVTCVLAATLAAPAPNPVPQIDVEEYTLDNGLTVLLSRDTRLPVVAVELRYLVGSANEDEGKTGFAHLFEHLMFQGSQNYNGEYFKPFEPIGGAVNGTTNKDRTNYFETVPSNYLELSLWMQSDRMQHFLPVLTKKKLDNQRDVVKNERRMRYENRPYGMSWMRLSERLYPQGHPYHHATIGYHEDLTAASLDDVKAFFARYYVPANAVLTIAGDFEPARARALVQKYFGPIPGGKRADKPAAETPILETMTSMVEEDEVKLPRVYMAWHTPAFFKPDDAEMDILATVLTDGKTSRLYKPLVYDKRIAKDVQAFQASSWHSSFFVVQATAAPGVSADQLYDALRAELGRALAQPPTADEMARAINGWRKSFFGRVEGAMSRAQMLSTYWHFVGDADYVGKDLARYTEMTAEEVHKAAIRHIDPDIHVRLDIVPKREAEAARGGAAAGGAQ